MKRNSGLYFIFFPLESVFLLFKKTFSVLKLGYSLVLSSKCLRVFTSYI